MAKIQLDFISESIENDRFYDDLKERNIEMRIVKVEGPAGGNPLVELRGTREALTDFLRTSYSPDDHEFYSTLIEE